jgi:hypothetical protein
MKRIIVNFFITRAVASIAKAESVNYAADSESILPLYGRVAIPFCLFILTLVSFAVARSQPNANGVLAIMTALMASALISSIAGFAFSAIAGVSIYHLVNSPLEAVTIMMFSSIAIQLYSVIR